MILVTGGSGSGKSEWAEKCAMEAANGGKLYYLATMNNEGDEARRRIKRHRDLRLGKGFDTIEEGMDVSRVLQRAGSSDTVLLEDLSNLLANLRYSAGIEFSDSEKIILRGIEKLSDGVRELVIVSNDIFADGYEYPSETEEYMKTLARLNSRFAASSHTVVEVVAGISIYHKRK